MIQNQPKIKQETESEQLKNAFMAVSIRLSKKISKTLNPKEIAAIKVIIPHLEIASLEMLDSIHDPDKDLTVLFISIASFYENQGFYQQAQDLYQRCLKQIQEILGEEHNQISLISNNLARIFFLEENIQLQKRFFKNLYL